MNNIVRAWKDETYRQSLSTQEQATLPVNPAGEVELTDTALEAIHGARGFCHRNSGFSSQDGNDGANSIDQDVDQKAAATFENKNVVIDSFVWCTAKNDADLDAHIRKKSFVL